MFFFSYSGIPRKDGSSWSSRCSRTSSESLFFKFWVTVWCFLCYFVLIEQLTLTGCVCKCWSVIVYLEAAQKQKKKQQNNKILQCRSNNSWFIIVPVPQEPWFSCCFFSFILTLASSSIIHECLVKLIFPLSSSANDSQLQTYITTLMRSESLPQQIHKILNKLYIYFLLLIILFCILLLVLQTLSAI